MMFEVGQMVVSIEDFTGCINAPLHPRLPRKGEIFTVREIVPFPDLVPGLCFEEIMSLANPDCGREQTFASKWFRPVRKTSIEELRKLVAPVPRQPVPVE